MERFASIFTVCTGQADNIGDIVLRRHFLDVLRHRGTLHIYMGAASTEFLEGLCLDPADHIYRDIDTWTAGLAAGAAAERVLVVDKPGEIILNTDCLRRQLKFWPVFSSVVKRGGGVVRLGVGVRSRPNLPQRILFRLVLSQYQLFTWRDTESLEWLGFGQLAPDWGFGDRGPDRPVEEPDGGAARDTLLLSQRSDRPLPSQKWIEGINRFAQQEGLRIEVVTQVQRDQGRTRELAKLLDCGRLGWTDEHPIEQERRLRERYRRAALVLSDRLHVLIVAMTEGAPSLCMTEYPENKIARHLRAVGYEGGSVRVDDFSPEQISSLCSATLQRREETRAAVRFARERLLSDPYPH